MPLLTAFLEFEELSLHYVTAIRDRKKRWLVPENELRLDLLQLCDVLRVAPPDVDFFRELLDLRQGFGEALEVRIIFRCVFDQIFEKQNVTRDLKLGGPVVRMRREGKELGGANFFGRT